MLSLKKHIALLSLLIFLLPIVISFLHSFENHHHNIVNTSKEGYHIHKKVDNDCEICDFKIVSFLNTTFKIDFFTNSLVEKVYSNNYFLLIYFKKLFFLLRAPPKLV